MPIRRRQVHPREDGYVAFEDLQQVVTQALLVQDLAGGVVSIVVDREATDLQGEMVTVAAVVEWKDRTDAKAAPEPAVERTPQTQTTNAEAQALANLAADPATVHLPVAEDIDYSTLPDEDLDPLPEPAR